MGKGFRRRLDDSGGVDSFGAGCVNLRGGKFKFSLRALGFLKTRGRIATHILWFSSRQYVSRLRCGRNVFPSGYTG